MSGYGKGTHAQQWEENTLHAKEVNAFWKIRGVEANARAVERKIPITREAKGKTESVKGKMVRTQYVETYDPPKLVKSIEITSNLRGRE